MTAPDKASSVAAHGRVDLKAPAARAIAVKGWWRASRWLISRRLSQVLALGLFLSGPLAGVWILRGTLSSSQLLGVVPFNDPLVLAQSLAAGHAVAATAWVGAALLVALYSVVGGRAYCSWLCPVNVLTDAVAWLRVRLGIRGGVPLARSARWWALAVVLVVSAVTGSVAWEAVNPVTVLHRGLVFGSLLPTSLAWGATSWMIVLGVALLDLVIAQRAWCGHLCPVGAAYAVIGRWSLLRVAALRREDCDRCMACFYACPEPQVLSQPLTVSAQTSSLVRASECTNCGRCLDVCHADVFTFTHRFDRQSKGSAMPLATDGDSRQSKKGELAK